MNCSILAPGKKFDSGNGREVEMTYPHIRPELKARIKSIVVPEAGGIDHLPDDVAALMCYPD